MQEALKVTKIKVFVLVCLAAVFLGCKNQTVVDNQVQIPKTNWIQGNKIETVFSADSAEKYNFSLRLRTTNEYKYHNLFLLFTVTDSLNKATTRRYTFKIADEEGQWLGSGSGNVFSYRFRLLSNQKFAGGRIRLSVAHNMRDNPLRGVTDAGIVVEKVEK